VILEPARRGIEGIPDSHVDIFVGLVFRAAPLHDDLLSGNGDVDADVVELPLVMMAMRSFDDDPTAGDPLIEPVEPADLVSDVRFDGAEASMLRNEIAVEFACWVSIASEIIR
jgi:hypothetical protein